MTVMRIRGQRQEFLRQCPFNPGRSAAMAILACILSCGVSTTATSEQEPPYECPGATWWVRTDTVLECGCTPWHAGTREFWRWVDDPADTPDDRRREWLMAVANGMCAW